MSACTFSPIQPPPVQIPAMRAGDLDGRYIDTGPDLGAVGDAIPDASSVSILISRADGNPMTAGDLALAGAAWPITVDVSGLVVTIGFTAPLTAGGISYRITLVIDRTVQGRLLMRDLIMAVATTMG